MSSRFKQKFKHKPLDRHHSLRKCYNNTATTITSSRIPTLSISIMEQNSRTDFYLRFILRRILPALIFITFVIAGIGTLLFKLALAQDIPRPFVIGIVVTISILIIFVIAIALLIRLRKEKRSDLNNIQSRSPDPSLAFELARFQARRQQKKAQNALSQTHGQNTGGHTTGQEKNPGSPHVHWVQPSAAYSPNQQESHGVEDTSPRTQYPRSANPDESSADGFYPIPLFAASHSENMASKVKPKLRRTSSLEGIHDRFVKDGDRSSDFEPGVGLRISFEGETSEAGKKV